MTNDEIELLPCPFCGSEDIDHAFVRGYERGDQTQPVVGAGCNACGATGATVRVPDHSTGYREAAECWNRRPERAHVHADNMAVERVKESAEIERGDEVLELPPDGHPLHKLGQRLTALLDEHHWAECEHLLLEGWDHDRIDRKTGRHWRENSSLEVWFPFTAQELDTLRSERAQAAEPVGWFTEDHLTDSSATTYNREVAERWKAKGWPVTPIYTAPPARAELSDSLRRDVGAEPSPWQMAFHYYADHFANAKAEKLADEYVADLEAALGGGDGQ